MDVDASQYAEMSREMMHSTNWLQLFDRGSDYLDKPPLLFWISAASMKVFGVNNFGFKFPSIILALLAVFATYRLARHFYGEATGRMAALILAVCQGMFLMTNDIRTDTALMAWVTVALWMIAEVQVKRRWYYVLGGTAAIALGMMTKGPIALFVPLFAFGSHWLLRREWKRIFAWHHLLDVVLIALFLIPMSIGLYQQFDAQPLKVVHEATGTSGLRFFYWTQSFGRITGESPWNNGAGPEFLLSSMMWAFLPWILLFLAAMYLNVACIVKQRFKINATQEWVTTGGFILTYLSLCMSKYQLPHYIFVVFPLAAIMVAALLKAFFEGEFAGLFKAFTGIQAGIGILLLIGVFLLITLTFPVGWLGYLLWALAVAMWVYFAFIKKIKGRMLWSGVVLMILVNAFLTNHFYYQLQRYQLGSIMGRYILNQNIPADQVTFWRNDDPLNSLHFYAKQIILPTSDNDLPKSPSKYVLTMQKGIDTLNSLGITYEIVQEGQRFKISEVTPAFLNHKTRMDATTPWYFIRLKP